MKFKWLLFQCLIFTFSLYHTYCVVAKESFALSKWFYHYITHHKIPDKMVPFFGSSEKRILARRTIKSEEQYLLFTIFNKMQMNDYNLAVVDLITICKRHFVQHVILIQMVYKDLVWENNQPLEEQRNSIVVKKKGTFLSLCHGWVLHHRLKLFRQVEQKIVNLITGIGIDLCNKK